MAASGNPVGVVDATAADRFLGFYVEGPAAVGGESGFDAFAVGRGLGCVDEFCVGHVAERVVPIGFA